MSKKCVDVGFVEEKSGKLLHPKYFPSKIGGKPAWLDLMSSPNPLDLICKKCDNMLVFLCQVYAPFEDRSDCFHRTIFIFICKNGSCCQPNKVDNFKVFRSQLARKNDFYSFVPCEENDNKPFAMDKYPNLCFLCGIKAPSHCSKCKKAFYCSRQHQIFDWQKEHKESCLKSQQVEDNVYFTVTKAGKLLLYKEWELIVDEEEEEAISEVDPNKEMNKLRKMIEEKNAGTMSNISENELEQYTATLPEDKVFNKFSKRVARHPDQVLRYDKGGEPLWITNYSGNNVPNCQYCNAQRQFEFQIMPQLLNYINVGIDLNSIDWGILAVYTCKNSCNMGPAYKEELIIKQDLTT